MADVDKYPWMKWWAADWLADGALALCSPATRGIWADLRCHMHLMGRSGTITGNVASLARLGRCTAEEMKAAIAELEHSQACDLDTTSRECSGVVTLTDRLMFQEAKDRDLATLRQRKKRGGAPVTPESRDRGKKREVRRKKRPLPLLDFVDLKIPPALQSPVSVQAIRDWVAYKIKRREGYLAWDFLERKLAEFVPHGPEALAAAVNHSMGNNYSGLFPPKNGRQQSFIPGAGQNFQGGQLDDM